MGFEKPILESPSNDNLKEKLHEVSAEEVENALNDVRSIPDLMLILTKLQNVPASEGRRIETGRMVKILGDFLDIGYVAPEIAGRVVQEFWANNEVSFTRVGGIREKVRHLIEERLAEKQSSAVNPESTEVDQEMSAQYELVSRWMETGSTIKVLRSSGEVEGGWTVIMVPPWNESWKTTTDIPVLVTNGEIQKRVRLGELLTWQGA